MAKAAIIHNPGGGSASDEDLARAKEILCGHFGQCDVHVVDGDASPGVLAERALASGSRLLIAAGGDGTVSSVAATLIGHPEASLGILPRGTANSIAGCLGIPSDLEGACAVIAGGHARLIDTGRVNGRPMILLATIGVHADAIVEADPERKRRYGALAYVLEEVSRMLDGELFDVTIEANGQRGTFAANAVTVANLAPPGNLLAQGPATIDDDDGLLDVTVVAIRGFGEALATSFHLATRALLEQPAERENVGFFRTKSVRIETAAPRRVMVDGEDAAETPITIEALPKSLRVLVPADAE
ncbi:MAG: diacylglycerol kinase family protein [Polyangiales bacterium]